MVQIVHFAKNEPKNTTKSYNIQNFTLTSANTAIGVTTVLSSWSALREKIPNLQCTCSAHTGHMVHTYEDSHMYESILWQSKYDTLSTLGSRYHSMGSGGQKTRDNTWGCAELGPFNVYLWSNNGACSGLHLGDSLCRYKLDQLTFTLRSELKEIHMEAPWLGNHLLFNRGQKGCGIKGFYAGWMREHVTDEQRHQRAVWGYITVPARPPSDNPYYLSSVVHLWHPRGRDSLNASTSGWDWSFADTEQCETEWSHVAFVGF